MADHVNSSSRVFIAEKDIQEQILDLNPIPRGIKEAPKMDVVTMGVLEKKARTNTVAKDNSLRKIHSKILNAFGPFTRVWRELDTATAGDMSCPVNMNLKDMKMQCDQTALLLGQAANAVSYLRRKSLLSNITSEKASKALLNSHKDLFEEDDPHNEIIPERVWDKVSDTNREIDRIVKAVRQ